jgi:Protein of unknown function (DUF732)
VRAIACCAAAAGLAMAGAPAAHADDAGYLAAVRALGFSQSDAYPIKGGHSVCTLMGQGHGPDELAGRIAGTTGAGAAQAHQLIALSVHEYCPQFNDRV